MAILVVDLQQTIKSRGTWVTAGRLSQRTRSLLVSVEVGLSAMCLIVAGLLVQSLVNLVKVDKGFDADRIAVVEANPASHRYPEPRKRGSSPI